MNEKPESEEFDEDEEEVAFEATNEVDFDHLAKDLDAAKKRGQKLGDPPWRRLERRLEEHDDGEQHGVGPDRGALSLLVHHGRARRHPGVGVPASTPAPTPDAPAPAPAVELTGASAEAIESRLDDGIHRVQIDAGDLVAALDQHVGQVFLGHRIAVLPGVDRRPDHLVGEGGDAPGRPYLRRRA